MLDLAAQLAAHGPLRVLDGGNQFNVYPVARAIRRRTSDLNAALQRIVLSRGREPAPAAGLYQPAPAGEPAGPGDRQRAPAGPHLPGTHRPVGPAAPDDHSHMGSPGTHPTR